MHALVMLIGLVGLATAAPATAAPSCPANPPYPPQSQSKGFTLVVNVTDVATDLSPSIQGFTLSTIHVGAGQALAGITNQSAPTWYVNGTEAEVKVDGQGSVITDGGTPLFPNGITVVAAKDYVSAVRVDAGPGTLGVRLATSPDPYTYLIAPAAGSYVACSEAVEYYQGQKFVLLKHAEATVGADGESTTHVPEGCAEIRLLPQCADLPELPAGSLSSHEFARTVGCYEDVSAIEWE